MARTHDEIFTSEERSLQGHARRYWVYYSVQLIVLGAGAISGAINAFAQSQAAQGTLYASSELLFWTGILSSLTAVIVGLGLTAAVAKQKSRRDFHKLMVGKLQRKRIKPKDAENTIDEYFEKWRD